MELFYQPFSILLGHLSTGSGFFVIKKDLDQKDKIAIIISFRIFLEHEIAVTQSVINQFSLEWFYLSNLTFNTSLYLIRMIIKRLSKDNHQTTNQKPSYFKIFHVKASIDDNQTPVANLKFDTIELNQIFSLDSLLITFKLS